MDVRYLLLLILLVSCMPSAKVSNGNLSDGSTTDDTTKIPDSATQWNYLSTLSSSITINVSNLNNSYVAGKNIEVFLATASNFAADYCMVSRYNVNSLTYELRTRVVPISYYDFTAKRTVRIFRVDFNDVANSTSICGTQSLMVLDSNGASVADTATIYNRTANPAQLCTTCTSKLNSNKVTIFKKGLSTLDQLSLAQIDIRTLTLSVDPNNNSSSGGGTCSQSACAARGFDCCLDNQCITDGAVKPTAYTQYPSQIASAEQERLSNPLAYLNYPHLYYICGTSVPGSTTGSSTSGSGGGYTQGLEQLKKDYFCVEKMKQLKTGATFHQDLLTDPNFFPDDPDIADISGVASTLYPLDVECRNNNGDPASVMNYLNVVKRLYQNCGCAKTTLSEMVASCPAYEYSYNHLENGIPNRIDCYTPPLTETPSVPTQQTVSVSSRSAPHRFFKTCGAEAGSTTACPSGDNQEGDFFEYLDSGNVLPSQQAFGMNSILGPMTVTLDKALPAKAVTVELDQVYQLNTTSGFYTPCPTCGKDSWFSSFSAYPTSSYGVGLRNVGFSTQRDLFDNNSTGGNYEDTIFGRACWVPPTMLPFSHYAGYGGTQAQRLARLKTQAALYANGYQKDWYGFNKGALIGSFDGVSWFAIGNGRIVRSTSTKLYLAINAPFADLASPTLHVVNVQAYDGVNQAAQLDYDPALHLTHSYQNMAGTCQANHMCNVDKDCVTKLGWEYMCADVQGLKSNWPVFDSNANETPNGTQNLTIDQILAQKRFPSASTKRCVYRGAGSLCVPNPGVIADFNKRKTLTCAPNFYCANVNTAGAVFNSKVARYASNLENIPVTRNHYFGKDANVLGRPLSYVASSLTTTLPNDVRQNLTQNLTAYEAQAASGTGICLPGKALPETANQTTLYNPYEQHKAADVLGRADFINQIASCNSGLFSSYRYTSCPVIGNDGNYEFLSSTFTLTNYTSKSRAQNSCGLDALLDTSNLGSGSDALSVNSPFRTVEAKTLANQTVISPSITRDACLRRAGSVCHTDLDCGPNKLMAEQVENFSLAYFGNESEKQYYSEYLVCGQGTPKPLPNDTAGSNAYSMSNNVCCREIGLDLTTVTNYIPNLINPHAASNTNSSTIDDEYMTKSYGLKTSTAVGTIPNDKLRYSRFASVENLTLSERPILSAFQDRIAPGSFVLGNAQGTNVGTPNQWKTLNETNSESCCGGGWVRKFSDGSNDWTRRDRVYMDVTNFACINSRSVLLTNPADVASQYDNDPVKVQSLVNEDMGSYCKDIAGAKGSCAKFTISDTTTDTGPSPSLIVAPNGTNYTGHLKSSNLDFANYKDFYFYPRSMDADPEITVDYTKTTGRRHFKIKIPSYISLQYYDNVIDAIPDYTTSAGAANVAIYDKVSESTMMCRKIPLANMSGLVSPTNGDIPTICTPGSGCCWAFDKPNRILTVLPEHNGSFGAGVPGQNLKIGVKLIGAVPAGGRPYPAAPLITRNTPGTNSYYLKRLGRFELSGIPQVNFQPITCSDNADRVVPGLFKKTGAPDLRIGQFNDPDYSFTSSYTDTDGSLISSSYVNRHAIAHEPVFSENDFKCCAPLGTKTNSKTRCCSGYGTASSSGTTFTCSLPDGADLMVYFNRYVSNEGQGTTQPGGGLAEGDFNLSTGEPRLTGVITQKIAALGAAYCESKKVRQGGAFGSYKLEPNGSDTNQNDRNYEIVDSSADLGQITTSSGNVQVGYSAFMAGFRWNHHLYCEDQN